MLVDSEQPMALISKGFKKFQKEKVPLFMNSGASDIMFVSRESFNDYKPIIPHTGDLAKAVDSNFKIIGEGTIIQHYLDNGQEQDITYTHALHTLTLNTNSISISAFDRVGLTTTFGNGKGTIQKSDWTIILTGRNVNGMYLLEALDNISDTPIAMISLSQPTSLEQWHRQLTHYSPLIIQGMVSNNLVDELKITSNTVSGKYEDCILSRQMCCPFDGVTERNLAPLELVAFNLWGPSCVESGGRKFYMMLIVNSGTSYKHDVYTTDKSDSTTIEVFNSFHTKAETMTGKKICCLRTDQAFDSVAWKEYCQCHGVMHELTMPYSLAQNGLTEQAIRTTIDNVHTLLHDSNLSHSYLAEAAAYSIETCNLIPFQ